jgi:hypothetical protein
MRKILAALAVLLAAFVIACGASGSDEPAPGNKQKPVSAATTAEEPPVAEPPPPVKPLASDFMLKVITLSKQCFGSAGCNVTYRIEVGYGGLPLAEDEEYTVTYAVTGPEGGPQVNNFKLRGDQVEYQPEEFASTPSSKTVLTAKVTQVLS